MNENIPLEDFIVSPDTIPLTVRDGSLASEAFRQAHHIRSGSMLTGDYRVDYVDRDQIQGMIADAGEGALSMLPIIMGLLDRESLEAAGIIRVQNHPSLDLRGRGTLIGFVDTGIDYTQDAFTYEDGSSKIRWIWDQTLRGNPPAGFHFGREYSREEIHAALQSPIPREIVDHGDESGHGTFLASLAAGRDTGNHIGAAPEAEIIAVKLKKAEPFFYEHFSIPEWQENAYTSGYVMLGIQYILNKAEELKRPVAICLALGSHTGGHDGFSVIEEYLGRISNITGVAIVCAAGNESQAGHHTFGKIYAPGEFNHVELVADGGGDIYLSMFNGASDRMSVSVLSPAGELTPRIQVRSGSSYSTNLVMEKSRVTVEYFLPLRGSGDQLTTVKILHPTPGIWRITIHGEIVLDGTYHLWLPVTGLGSPGVTFLTPAPDYTVVIPATTPGVITCGAYDSLSGSLYPASSWGPTRRMAISPDFVAPGVNVGGIYPTGYGRMSGSSVSAAITAGACALMLQWGIVDGNDASLATSRIRSNLIRGCSRGIAAEYPNIQWGYGKLNLFNTLYVIRTAP